MDKLADSHEKNLINMEQSFIVVEEISENLLLEGLMDFANQYSDDKFVEDIILYRKKEVESFLILFTNVPNFDHFCFAVNYVRYIKTKTKKLPVAFGYYQNNSATNTQYFLTNGFVKVYVSKNDKEYDNVNVVNRNNETYLYDFGGRISKLSMIEEPFNIPTFDINDYNHILNITPAPKENKPWWRMW